MLAEMLFPIFVVQSSFIFNACESKMRSNRSVATSQVDYVDRFSVSAVSSVSLVNQHLVHLFLLHTRGSERVLFSGVFFFSNVVLSATKF